MPLLLWITIPGGYLTEETTKEKAVNNVVEENTQSNVSKKDYLYGLSSEAAAQIKTLKFNKNSKLIWPVEGSIIMPYDVKNTVYYATLDLYKKINFNIPQFSHHRKC